MKNVANTEGRRYSYLTSEIEASYHEAASKFKLSDSAMRILYTICLKGEEGLLSDIVRLSGISKQTINSSLLKLETDGIVYLKTADSRKKKVCLTEKGKALAQNSALQVLRFENEILDSWTEEEQQVYIELTERFLSSFKEKIKEIKA